MSNMKKKQWRIEGVKLECLVWTDNEMKLLGVTLGYKSANIPGSRLVNLAQKL